MAIGCSLLNYKTLKIGDKEFEGSERIRKFLEFDSVVIIYTDAKKGDPEFSLPINGGNVFCIEKETAKILWQSKERFTEIWKTKNKEIVMAGDPEGFDVTLDLKTGKVLKGVFTK